MICAKENPPACDGRAWDHRVELDATRRAPGRGQRFRLAVARSQSVSSPGGHEDHQDATASVSAGQAPPPCERKAARIDPCGSQLPFYVEHPGCLARSKDRRQAGLLHGCQVARQRARLVRFCPRRQRFHPSPVPSAAKPRKPSRSFTSLPLPRPWPARAGRSRRSSNGPSFRTSEHPSALPRVSATFRWPYLPGLPVLGFIVGCHPNNPVGPSQVIHRRHSTDACTLRSKSSHTLTQLVAGVRLARFQSRCPTGPRSFQVADCHPTGGGGTGFQWLHKAPSKGAVTRLSYPEAPGFPRCHRSQTSPLRPP